MDDMATHERRTDARCATGFLDHEAIQYLAQRYEMPLSMPVQGRTLCRGPHHPI